MKRTLYIILIFLLTLGLYSEDIEIQLENLISLHPEIKSLEAELKSKKANAGHETTYPDPKIGIAFRNYPARSYSLNDKAYDTPSMTGIEYSISQEIPFPGRLTLQGKVSKLGELEFLHLSKSRKNQFLLEYLTQLVRLKSAEKKIVLNELIRKTLESQKTISTSTLAVGGSNLSKSLKLQVEASLSQEREIEYTKDKKNAIAALEYFKVDTSSKDLLIKLDPSKYLKEKAIQIKSEKNILKENLIENPNYKLSSVAIERAKNESKLSSLLHAPDTEVFFAYMKRRNQIITLDNGPLNYQIMDNTEYRGDLFSFGVNVRVPVWSFFSSHDLKQRSEENVQSKAFELERNKLFLESNFEKLLVTLDSIDLQIDLYEKRIIPELNKSLSALSSQYGTGKVDLIEVLNSKIELQRAFITEEELQEKKKITTLLLLELTDHLLKPKEGN
ncbi:MAG TPA: TolC family protein [Leptospiraceae bacterium]|nr:TolC family protein [Leptospiraceae bacterium]HMX32820.1 TolC family protein [Leptospiraceae bacterium]HMY33860.1 TolC family protein [Leptospiraceae bacterium]HMZ64478.1 TolC family protein [Leptospiraceae bacterium]HNA10119.1 TolC family protein [Leptospiraceae bacterium]